MGDTGLEPGSVSSCKSSALGIPVRERGAESGADSAETAPVHPDLAKVIEAWPTLPEAVRAGILAMVEAAKPK
ncbi:MAG TPA: hypothetical protein VNA25_04610 [Phycisphaerae bacterium]|nr:hypothetical protein [Phycisphaerae bacterium]